MIAPVKTQRPQSMDAQHHARFLAMLPLIRSRAKAAFRSLQLEHRQEMIAEVVASAFCFYVSLVRRGKTDVAFATPLADFAIRRALAGRRVGAKGNASDITSPYAQAVHNIVVERLNTFDYKQGDWREALVEDRRASPADMAIARIDMAAWLRALPPERRRIAKFLATGESTRAAARRFSLSPARISQLRGLLKANWERFQGGDAYRY